MIVEIINKMSQISQISQTSVFPNTCVLYNTQYGRFSFNRQFELELFQRFPPSCRAGQDFFKEIPIPTNFEECHFTPFFGNYQFIHSPNDYDDEASYAIDITTNKVYCLSTDEKEHRANKNLISFLFERAEKLTEKDFNAEYDKCFASLWKCEQRELTTDDGEHKFSFHNWKESDLLLSHFLTLNICGSLSDLCIEQVKPGLIWSISNYDGCEQVIKQFDYYKLISELVHELQINNVQPSLECSEILTNVICGAMTIDQMKKYEQT